MGSHGTQGFEELHFGSASEHSFFVMLLWVKLLQGLRR